MEAIREEWKDGGGSCLDAMACLQTPSSRALTANSKG